MCSYWTKPTDSLGICDSGNQQPKVKWIRYSVACSWSPEPFLALWPLFPEQGRPRERYMLKRTPSAWLLGRSLCKWQISTSYLFTVLANTYFTQGLCKASYRWYYLFLWGALWGRYNDFPPFMEGQRGWVTAKVKQLLSVSIGIQILVHFQSTDFCQYYVVWYFY